MNLPGDYKNLLAYQLTVASCLELDEEKVGEIQTYFLDKGISSIVFGECEIRICNTDKLCETTINQLKADGFEVDSREISWNRWLPIAHKDIVTERLAKAQQSMKLVDNVDLPAYQLCVANCLKLVDRMELPGDYKNLPAYQLTVANCLELDEDKVFKIEKYFWDKGILAIFGSVETYLCRTDKLFETVAEQLITDGFYVNYNFKEIEWNHWLPIAHKDIITERLKLVEQHNNKKNINLN